MSLPLDDQLIEASKAGKVTLCASLIEQGANIDAQDADTRTPLYWASRNAHLDVFRLLVEKGAHLDIVANFHPLHWAACDGHQDLCEMLIEKGVDPDAKDDEGRTALVWSQSMRDSINLTLIAYGADASQSPDEILRDLTPRQAAARGGLTKRLITLLSDHPSDKPGDDPQSLLSLAQKHRQDDTAAAIQSFLARQTMLNVMQPATTKPSRS